MNNIAEFIVSALEGRKDILAGRAIAVGLTAPFEASFSPDHVLKHTPPPDAIMCDVQYYLHDQIYLVPWTNGLSVFEESEFALYPNRWLEIDGSIYGLFEGKLDNRQLALALDLDNTYINPVGYCCVALDECMHHLQINGLLLICYDDEGFCYSSQQTPIVIRTVSTLNGESAIEHSIRMTATETALPER